MSDEPTDGAFPAGRWLRAVRRRRKLSQRELAQLAGVTLSTVSAIEAGRRSPGVELLGRILVSTGFRLTIVDCRVDPSAGSSADPSADSSADSGADSSADSSAGSSAGSGAGSSAAGEIAPDDEHDRVRDRSGRRFPAHLRWAGRPDYYGGYWWGWERIAWPDSPSEMVPDHVYWQRDRELDPDRPRREHPWHGY